MEVKVEGERLSLPTGGGGNTGIPKRYPNIVARLTEPAPAHYREVAISRDARGDYYASFVTEQPDESERDGGTLAIDLGIKTLATGVSEQGRGYIIRGSNRPPPLNNPPRPTTPRPGHTRKNTPPPTPP